MKTFFSSLLIAVLITGSVGAQSPRKVLYEHFTQASCGPCASVNPQLHPILDRNKDKLVRITHQVSWPGVDPMNKDNPGEVQSRVSYYGITGVPSSRMNGQVAQVTPTIAVNDATIAAAAAIPSPYEIELTPEVQSNVSELKLKVRVKLTGSFSGRPVLRVAVLEKIIRWPQAPGSNGEKEFHHVMKKFLPGTAGSSLSNLTSTGEEVVFNFDYKFDKLYDFRNLEVAAYIQNEENKEIMQAEGTEVEFPKKSGPDVTLRSGSPGLATDSDIICGKSTTPRINFINMGDQTLTSVRFEYSANDGTVSSYDWTGSLTYLKETNITLASVEIPVLKTHANSIRLRAVMINGTAPAAVPEFEIPFEAPPVSTLKARLEIKPLSKPDLLVFDVTDDQGKVILRGGPFQDNSLKTFELDLQENNCYKLNVNNRHISVNGTARLYNDQNELLISTTLSSQKLFVNPFTTYPLVAVEGPEAFRPLDVVPNPASDRVEVLWESRSAGSAILNVIDLEGRIVHTSVLQSPLGQIRYEIPVQDWIGGHYLVQLRTATASYQKRLVIAR